MHQCDDKREENERVQPHKATQRARIKSPALQPYLSKPAHRSNRSVSFSVAVPVDRRARTHLTPTAPWPPSAPRWRRPAATTSEVVVPEEIVLGFDRGKHVPVLVTIDAGYA